MATKVQNVLRYSVVIFPFWMGMAFLLAAARYATYQSAPVVDKYWGVAYSYGDLVLRYFSGLTVAVLLVPLLGLYAYRLVVASQSLVRVLVKIIAATLIYYILHLSYFIVLAKITQDVSLVQVLLSLSFVEWVWGVFFVLTSIIGGLALGFNKRRQLAEVAKFELDKMLLEMEAKLTSEQNDHIRQRLGSHFVLNALSNIIALVRKKKNDEAIEALHLLSDILREIAQADQEVMHSLEDELTFLNKYLSFQNIRFPNLKVDWDIADNVEGMQLPNHIVQPLVENAFKHGMQADGQLSLAVAASRNNGNLHVQVRNSMSSKRLTAPGGEGQVLTALRLEKAYNRSDLFKCAVVNNEYVADLIIPGEGGHD